MDLAHRGRQACEPSLQKRRAGRYHEEGQSDGDGHGPKQPPHRIRRRGELRIAERNRQRNHRQHQYDHVERDLAADAEPSRRKMGVQISEQQCRLEKQDTGIPDRRAAAQPWQGKLGEHRLNEEQQTGADEDGRSEERNDA